MSGDANQDPLQLLRHTKHKLFVARRGALAQIDALTFRAHHRAVLRRAAAEIVLPPLPRARAGEIWGIAMVRNEEDILARSIEQLSSQGIDRILVVDNGSTDGTRDILAALAHDHPLVIGQDRWVAYQQSAKMTVLAAHARRAGARWVVPFDADEMWMGKDGTVAEVLHRSTTPIVLSELVNAFPHPASDGSWRLDPAPHHDPKVAFRPCRGAVLSMGNHRALRWGDISVGLGIVHAPWRSFDQFRAKVRHGASAIEAAHLSSDLGWHWRRLGAMDDPALVEVWHKILRGEHVPENAWELGPGALPFQMSIPLNWSSVTGLRDTKET